MKEQEDEKFSSVFLRQNPLQFERFVADIIEKVYGRVTTVTIASGDYGIDFEHRLNGELFLGQVKCYKDDMPFDAIAKVHSNMVKHGAKGGYVVTTGSFTENARTYAHGLEIQLISGDVLAEMYMQSLETQSIPTPNLTPAT